MSNYSDFFGVGSSGGGGGIPINGYLPFTVSATNNPTGYDATTGLYTHPDGTFWVQTGNQILGSYPDATQQGSSYYTGFSFTVTSPAPITDPAGWITYNDNTGFMETNGRPDTLNQTKVIGFDASGTYQFQQAFPNDSVGSGATFGGGAYTSGPDRLYYAKANNIFGTAIGWVFRTNGARGAKALAQSIFPNVTFGVDTNDVDTYYYLRNDTNTVHIVDAATNTQTGTMSYAATGMAAGQGIGVSYIRGTGTYAGGWVVSGNSTYYVFNSGGTYTGFNFPADAASGHVFQNTFTCNPDGNMYIMNMSTDTVHRYNIDTTTPIVGDSTAKTDTDTAQPLFVRIK